MAGTFIRFAAGRSAPPRGACRAAARGMAQQCGGIQDDQGKPAVLQQEIHADPVIAKADQAVDVMKAQRPDGDKGAQDRQSGQRHRIAPHLPPQAAKPGQKAHRQGQQRQGGPRQDRNAQQRPFAAEPGLSPAVLRSWFPESAGQPGRKRRGIKPGAEVTFQDGQFQARQRDDRHGNRAVPNTPPRGNAYGNSRRDGAPGQRTPYGGSPGNSIHDDNRGNRAPSNRAPANRAPGNNNNRGRNNRGPRPR